jgi:hypothetical protein
MHIPFRFYQRYEPTRGERKARPEADEIALLAPKSHKSRDARSLATSGVPCGSPDGALFEPHLTRRIGHVYTLRDVITP